MRDAIEVAWIDSDTASPTGRHEEGGWIYMNVETGAVFTDRVDAGAQAHIDLSQPPHHPGAVIVGTFHTHPNPSAEGWDPYPSVSDQQMEGSRGTPGIVRSDKGYHPYGPERRASLEGNWFFPGTAENPL